MAKAGSWTLTDAEARRPGERKGLDTPVVLAVNGARLVWEQIKKIVPQEEETANSVPAAAVIQRSQALFGITGRKACVGCFVSRV